MAAGRVELLSAAKLQQSSAALLANLDLIGQAASRLNPSMLDLWMMATRAAAILQESCRVAAGSAAKSACQDLFMSGYISIEADLLICRLVANQCQRISVS